jgi:hypothetical protein
MAENHDVYDRIKKLLALTEGRGATEAEAALAMEHVQRLLQDHGLTLAQVEASSGETAGDRSKIVTDLRAAYAYQLDLMRTLAENNFCLHTVRTVTARTEKPRWDGRAGRYVQERRSKRHVLVGRELNVRVTTETYAYLLEALTRASSYDPRSADGKTFLEGGVARLVERLSERRRQREAESEANRTAASTIGNGTHRELVLTDVYGSEADQNNDVLNGFPIGTTAARRRERAAENARREGERARLVAEGVDQIVATYRSYGYAPERAEELAASYRATVAAAPRSRGGRSNGGRSNGGRSNGWTHGQEAHYRRVNSASYRAGKAAGDAIGLDDQVGRARRPTLPRS